MGTITDSSAGGIEGGREEDATGAGVAEVEGCGADWGAGGVWADVVEDVEG